jgi:hypothetical protein
LRNEKCNIGKPLIFMVGAGGVSPWGTGSSMAVSVLVHIVMPKHLPYIFFRNRARVDLNGEIAIKIWVRI